MFSNLQTDYLPDLDGIISVRKLQLAKRRSRSAFLAWQRRQYFLTSAHRDLRRAIAYNEDIIIGVAIIALVLAYSSATVAAQVLIDVFEAIYSFSLANSAIFLPLFITATGVLSVTAAWLAALMLNSLSTALLHGANRKQNRSLRSTLHQSLQMTTRTATVWARTAIVVGWPTAAAALASLATAAIVGLSGTNVLVPILIALIGILISTNRLLNLSLTPFVALFEPKLSFKAAANASRQLVASKGRMFLLATYTSALIALFATYELSVLLVKIDFSQALTLVLGSLLITVYGNSLLVMLYSKRRRARN